MTPKPKVFTGARLNDLSEEVCFADSTSAHFLNFVANTPQILFMLVGASGFVPIFEQLNIIEVT